MDEAKYDVYLSYDAGDQAYAHRIADELEWVGVKVCRDHPSTGPERDSTLKSILEQGGVQVVVWSKDGAASGRLQSEARIGAAQGRLIATRVESVLPPRGTDAHTYADLSDWRGGTEHRGMQKLLGAIHSLTGKGVAATLAPPPVPQGQASAFEQLSREEQDARAWQIACSYDNKTYYEHYLEHIPWGQHREEAMQRINRKKNRGKLILGIAVGFWLLYFIVYIFFVLAGM